MLPFLPALPSLHEIMGLPPTQEDAEDHTSARNSYLSSETIEHAKPPNDPEACEPQSPPLAIDVTGWRRTLLFTAIFIGQFLSFLDTTIVSVALATIASQFDDYSRSTWVVTAYLLTYMAFAIVITRLSDIFGRKTIEIASFVIFLGFSLGCALSQSMTQLIIFRAFQGIGGSGLFSMTIVIGLNAVKPKSRSAVSAGVAVNIAIAGVLGPVISGAITKNHHSSTWRWIFYLNLPLGGLALAALLVSWPSDKSRQRFTRKALLSIDYLGTALLLAAGTLFIFALQEGGARIYAWNSATIITCFVISILALFAFIGWQKWLASHPDLPVKLLFPLHLAGDRVVGSAMVVMLLTGFVYYIAVINLPQRFQIVDGDSPILAGVKLLPMLASSATASLISGAINVRRNFNAETLILASAFQLLGYGLLTTLGDSYPTPVSVYGFEVFIGLGFGAASTISTLLVNLNVEPRWVSVAQGAMTQARALGGSVGLAVAVTVFNNEIRGSRALSSLLSSKQLSALYKSPLVISLLSPAEQALAAKVYAKAFTQEMRIATYIAAACFVASLLTWEKNPPSPLEPAAGEEEELESEDKPR